MGRGTQRVEETLGGAASGGAHPAHRPRQRAQAAASWRARSEASAAAKATSWSARSCSPKGHDFPNLTLVGVLNADSALLSTDYRAAERLFAALAQVAGRAGRRERARAKCWCRRAIPGHPLYQALVRHDYAGFAALAAGRAQGRRLPALRLRGGAARRGDEARRHDARSCARGRLGRRRAEACASTTRCRT